MTAEQYIEISKQYHDPLNPNNAQDQAWEQLSPEERDRYHALKMRSPADVRRAKHNVLRPKFKDFLARPLEEQQLILAIADVLDWVKGCEGTKFEKMLVGDKDIGDYFK